MASIKVVRTPIVKLSLSVVRPPIVKLSLSVDETITLVQALRHSVDNRVMEVGERQDMCKLIEQLNTGVVDATV